MTQVLTDTACALVPGHVTGCFGVCRADDPVATGSIGAGVAIGDPIEVTVRPPTTPDGGIQADKRREHPYGQTQFNGEHLTIAPVDRLRRILGVSMDIEVTSPFPLGAGFGVSGAVTLGTALATTVVTDRTATQAEITKQAHIAEVEAATGLGDVVAQATGGMVLRLEPGADGTIDTIPAQGRVEYLVLGDLSTPAVLHDDTEALTAAGQQALERITTTPTPETFVQAANAFAEDAGLYTDAVVEVIDAVEAAGGQAIMSMLGETVVAFGTGLSDAGYEPAMTTIDHAGARLGSDCF